MDQNFAGLQLCEILFILIIERGRWLLLKSGWDIRSEVGSWFALHESVNWFVSWRWLFLHGPAHDSLSFSNPCFTFLSRLSTTSRNLHFNSFFFFKTINHIQLLHFHLYIKTLHFYNYFCKYDIKFLWKNTLLVLHMKTLLIYKFVVSLKMILFYSDRNAPNARSGTNAPENSNTCR